MEERHKQYYEKINIDYGKFTPYLVKAVQEMITTIDGQKDEIQQIKDEIQQLKDNIQQSTNFST